MTDTVIVLFSRDLRVHDHPALAAACERARHVIPLFVADPAVPAGNRRGFLAECLADLRGSLRERGGDLVVRHGDQVAETMRLAGESEAQAVYTSMDVSALAHRRQRRLAEECERARMAFHAFPGLTIVPPDALRPSGGGDHYRVFTPYWRAWAQQPRREVLKAPGMVHVPEGLRPGKLPEPEREPYELFRGGETVGRRRMSQWLRHCVDDYADGHDDMAGNRTSRLSPYLRFGCVSPLELESLAGGPEEGGGGEEYVRQLCWRDFFYQVTRAFPRINRDDYRPRGHEWRDDDHAAQAWKEGHDRGPDRGRRDAAAARRGLDAQPGPA